MAVKFSFLLIFMFIVSAMAIADEIMEEFKKFEEKEESNLEEILINIVKVVGVAKKIGCNITSTVKSK